MKLLQYAIRNTQYAIRNTQYAIRNYYAIIILLIFAIALSSCGLRNNDSVTANNTDTPPTTPLTCRNNEMLNTATNMCEPISPLTCGSNEMLNTATNMCEPIPPLTCGSNEMLNTDTNMCVAIPPADTPLPPAPNFNAINSLPSAQRLPVINAVANTENDSITKSAPTQDSVSAVANNAGLGFFVNEGERADIRVDNLNPDADWTGTNAPSLSAFSYIFDKDTGDSKTLADYENGDFYAVTGFWYRSPTDFGVFADGSPRTEPLPPSGSANYRGNVGGQYWGDIATRTDDTGAPNISGSFVGNINLQMNVSNNPNGDSFLTGQINIPAVNDLPFINFDLNDAFDNSGNGIFTGANLIVCIEGCSDPVADSMSARLVGDPVNIPGGDSEGFPAGIIGAFGIQDMRIGNTEVDMLGFFGAIHEDLCAATGTGDTSDNAFCTKP